MPLTATETTFTATRERQNTATTMQMTVSASTSRTSLLSARHCLLQSALVLSLLALSCHAVQDANAPWGDNTPPRFKNYWLEPGNVLEDIEQFDALYIKSVGCMWSEYGYDAYDDDGENRDGDENWYQGRTTAFRANTAYNLYGVRRGFFSFLTLRKCSEHTYINTFITNNGADSILNVTGRLSSSDDFYNGYGRAYCYEAGQDDDDGGRRNLGSGDNNNGNDDSMSTTMGCSLEGYRYAMAVFQGDYCDGRYFLEIDDDMKDYNRQQNKVKCDKIWDYSSAFKKGERVDTPADSLLEESSSCSNAMYDGHCPDPYGVNKAYKRAISKSGPPLQATARVLSWMSLVVGLVLIATAYFAKNRRSIQRRGIRHFFPKRQRSDVGDTEASEGEGKSKSKRRSRRMMPRSAKDVTSITSSEPGVEYSSPDMNERKRSSFKKKRRSFKSRSSKSSGKSKSSRSSRVPADSGEMA